MTLLFEWAMIFIGAGIGSVLRHLVSGWVGFRVGPGFPWGTLVVNVLGCFALGLLTASMQQERALLFVLSGGVIGGFTTFSTLMFESANLALSREGLRVFSNIFGNLVLGIVALVIGLFVGSFL